MTNPNQVFQGEFYYDQILDIQVEIEALRAEVWKDYPDFHRMEDAVMRLTTAAQRMARYWQPPPDFSEEE